MHSIPLMLFFQIIYFPGVQLDSKTKEIEWNPEKNSSKEEKEDEMIYRCHSLMIKEAILSHEAVDGEVAVIEAEAVGYELSNIKTLISVLVQGKDRQHSLGLVFHDPPVKLRLVQGSGPVHLVGVHHVDESLKINGFELATNFIYLFVGWRCSDEDDSSDEEDSGKMKHVEHEEEKVDINLANKKKVRFSLPLISKNGKDSI